MSLHYENPVYPFEFADPFVLRTAKGYFAYGTGPVSGDSRVFPLLYSADLVHWKFLGGALVPLSRPPAVAYWAPEVIENDGTFLLFYSASTTSSDDSHRLRMAISSDPQGPFHDSGKVLLPEIGFAIDASPYHDPVSGQHYLFFATDYESDVPQGTGVALVKLNREWAPATAPVTVVRACADWQIFQRQRQYKGRLWDKWYCVEGPHCVYHDGKYFCFYSGGAWFGSDYGIGFAWADRLEGPWHDELGASGPSVLKGIPGKVLGPGHSSSFIGPDNRTRYLAYHAWDPARSARRMCIDPLIWKDSRPVVDGPSTSVRVLPEPAASV